MRRREHWTGNGSPEVAPFAGDRLGVIPRSFPRRANRAVASPILMSSALGGVMKCRLPVSVLMPAWTNFLREFVKPWRLGRPKFWNGSDVLDFLQVFAAENGH